jgi:hypothetical protein
MNYWKVFCMEDYYPGLWQRWFKNQCVAVGWCSKSGYKLNGGTTDKAWSEVRNALRLISRGDRILVQLKGNRVGRIGEVVGKQVRDNEWDPLVPQTQTEPDGDMGRRVIVRWDLNAGPSDAEMVVKLPASSYLPPGVLRATIRQLNASVFRSVERAMNDEANWVSLLAQFGYERSLSDYIGTYPQKLQDGLQPYPSTKVRERVFPDQSRSDVLLIDRNETPVVVECKQDTPTVEHVRQIRKYMKHVRRETGKRPRGILVHGGARKLLRDVSREINQKPRIEVVQYSLKVDFAPCK